MDLSHHRHQYHSHPLSHSYPQPSLTQSQSHSQNQNQNHNVLPSPISIVSSAHQPLPPLQSPKDRDVRPREPDVRGASADADEPATKKQKRNKPTLSCHECVERKTKVRCVPLPQVPLFRLVLSYSRAQTHFPLCLAWHLV